MMIVDDANSRNRTPIKKGTGITGAERYLKTLCDRTFLSLWSYPGVYRDQGGGKEVCDLLVVFRNHIIIFSDKDCVFPDTGNLTNDWNRWYKRAIKNSAEQIWGAERWIKEYPDRLFLDSKCQQRFPIELPDPTNATFHRIVVAHSGAERCRREMNGGSGSLIIDSNITGDMHYAGEPNYGKPLWVGQVDPTKGFIHVLDDTSLDIVMKTLDTVSDLTDYLTKKEHFLSGDRKVLAAGEEELLSYYLKRMNEAGEHDFVFEGDYDGVFIDEGGWEEFQRNPQRLAQIAANEISYSWDALIEQFNHHILEDTQYFASPRGVENGEKAIRFLAGESRTRRRLLIHHIFDLIKKTTPDQLRAVRISKPDRPYTPFYVFLLLRPSDASYEQYREVRGKLLEAYCMATKVIFPEALDIVGIATESGLDEFRSEDAMYLDAHDWTPELQEEAVKIRDELNLLKKTRFHEDKVSEYPDIVSTRSQNVVLPAVMKGRDRNAPCPCGSGRKFKKCCGAV